MVLTLKGDALKIFNDIKNFFINIWQNIENFCLQYVSQSVFNILIGALIVILILFVLLAVMNKNG